MILDNYCTHKRNEEWLAQLAGRVQFHFTPASASWLNQIEIVFRLLQRKTLRGASFQTKDQLREAIEAFIRKREVKGSQLRNTIINLGLVVRRLYADTCSTDLNGSAVDSS